MAGSNSLIRLITFLTIPAWISADTLSPEKKWAKVAEKKGEAATWEATKEWMSTHLHQHPHQDGLPEAKMQPHQSSTEAGIQDAGDIKKDAEGEDHINHDSFKNFRKKQQEEEALIKQDIKKSGEVVTHSADATDATSMMRREPRMPHAYGPTPSPAPPSPPSLIRWDHDQNYCLSVNTTNTSERLILAWCNATDNSTVNQARMAKYMRFKVPGSGALNQIQWSFDDSMCIKVKKDWVGNGDAIGLHSCADNQKDLAGRTAREGMMFTHTGGRKGEEMEGYHKINQKSAFEWDCTDSAEKELGKVAYCLKCIDVFYEYLHLTGKHYVQMWDRTNAPAQTWHVEDATDMNGIDTSAADR